MDRAHLEDAMGVTNNALLEAAGYAHRVQVGTAFESEQAGEVTPRIIRREITEEVGVTDSVSTRLTVFRRGHELNHEQAEEIERAVEALIQGVLERDRDASE